MSGLPAGTVTFLFTDIEGSTRLLQDLGDRYATLLADHHRLLRSAFSERGGTEVQDHGDGFYYSFPSAKAAVQTAVMAQRAVGAHAWPDGAAVRVRMGLHTGEPVSGAVADDLQRRLFGTECHTDPVRIVGRRSIGESSEGWSA